MRLWVWAHLDICLVRGWMAQPDIVVVHVILMTASVKKNSFPLNFGLLGVIGWILNSDIGLRLVHFEARAHSWTPWSHAQITRSWLFLCCWPAFWQILKSIWVNFWPKSNLRPVLGWHRSCLRPQNSQNKLTTALFLRPNWFGHTVLRLVELIFSWKV